MATRLNSHELFLAQVRNHSDELTRLLGSEPHTDVDATLLERSILSTGMLASSASLMELTEWQEFLKDFESLLVIYRAKSLPWDERLAQLTSELVEFEDQLVAKGSESGPPSVRQLTTREELNSLFEEVAELDTFAKAAAPHEPRSKRSEPPSDSQNAEDISDIPTIEPAKDHPVDEPLQEDYPLGKSIRDLRRHASCVLELWESSHRDIDAFSPTDLERFRRELMLINFYALSMEQIINLNSTPQGAVLTSLEPLRAAIGDSAAVLCAGTNRRIDISFHSLDHSVDARLLCAIETVLHHLVKDIYDRCNDQYLRIEVNVEDRYGSLFWSIRDNGNNFITDSRLDPDEYLAFYPGLKETRQVLSELRSLLWVEPDENHETRFWFTIPTLPDGGNIVVWQHEGEHFGVLSNQVSDVIPVGDVRIENDSKGEFVMVRGGRIPLVRLGQIYSGAPEDGNMVVVVGCLEKMIAFCAEGEGEVATGIWQPAAVAAWKGMDRGIIDVGGRKISLVEANSLMRRYRSIVGTNGDLDVSGGGIGDIDDLSRSQANVEKDVATPPETPSARILVVERSEILRDNFASIFMEKQLDAHFVSTLDDALEWLEDHSPDLILCEFRVPSMAARVVVDALQKEDRRIPVLVTTTHQGDNAGMLVEKIGATGYIGKPLVPEDVLARIGQFIPEAAATGRP